MKKSLVAVLTAASLLLAPAAFAAPGNDAMADAQPVSSLPATFTSDTSDATAESGEPHPSCADTGATVWFVLTDMSDRIRIDTVGSDFDTTLGVYRTDGDNDLVEVTCNDDIDLQEDNLQSAVTFTPIATETYFVQAGGFEGDSGALTVTFAPSGQDGGAPVNDDFENAIQLSVPSEVIIDLSSATFEDGEPSSCGNGDDRTAWYILSPTDARVLNITMESESFGAIAIYAGSTLDSLAHLGCRGHNPDRGPNDAPASSLARALVPGQDHYIQVMTSSPWEFTDDAPAAAAEAGVVKLTLAAAPYADIAVDHITVEPQKIETDAGISFTHRRTISASVSHVAGTAVAQGDVNFSICPRTSGLSCYYRDVPVDHLEPGASTRVSFDWSGTGAVGDMRISARADLAQVVDPVEDNNYADAQTYVLVGGTGYGVGLPCGWLFVNC